jgi:hypothetical protein
MDNYPQIGDVGFSHRKRGIYNRIVSFITGNYYSHTFIILKEFYGDVAVLEADLKCQVVSFKEEYINKNDDYWEIWRPVGVGIGAKLRETERCYIKYAGKTYGFLQIPWFIWKRIAKAIGVNPGKNWFPGGAICSEITCDYLPGLSGAYKEALPFGLNEVDPDDIRDVVAARPDLFKLIAVYKERV